MLTPYDWQESIGNRAQYIEGRLEQGLPVLAASVADGILLVTRFRQSPKLFEIYDRLAFGAIGQQSDVESIRTGAIDFAHQEGYSRSEADVTIQRVVAGLSTPLKRAFGDLGVAPVVARCLFAEVGPNPERDRFFVLDYDGDYRELSGSAVLALESNQEVEADLAALAGSKDSEGASKRMHELWATLAGDRVDGTSPETVLLDRSEHRVNRFRRLEPQS